MLKVRVVPDGFNVPLKKKNATEYGHDRRAEFVDTLAEIGVNLKAARTANRSAGWIETGVLSLFLPRGERLKKKSPHLL